MSGEIGRTATRARSAGAPGHPPAVVVHGGHPLHGDLRSSGFKHALVPLVSAAVMSRSPVTIRNVPDIEDTRVLAEILRQLGGTAAYDAGRRTLSLDCAGVTDGDLADELTVRIHGALYLFPVLLARLGWARLGPLGGCRIGAADRSGERPVEHVVDVLERFGARITADDTGLTARSSGLTAATVDLAGYAVPSPLDGKPTGPHYSGATKTALLAAATARGTSVLLNPYPKPDVTELVAALGAAGVPIARDGRRLIVEGSGGPLGGFDHTLVSDLIEIVTYVALAVHLRTPVHLADVTPAVRHGLRPELELFSRMGIDLSWQPSSLDVRPPDRLRPVDVVAASHSVFSDSQPFFALMLTHATGRSTIRDTVWHNRFQYIDGLNRLGGRLSGDGATVTVRPGRLARPGQRIAAPDLRTAAVSVIAALDVPGPTRVDGTGHLDRGYEHLIHSLRAAGARIDDAESVTP